MLRKIVISVLLFISVNFCMAQHKKATPKTGEGLHSFLVRNNLSPGKHKNKFIKLNKGKFGKNYSLLSGVSYKLPDNSISGTSSTNKYYNETLFGRKYAKFKQESNDLGGAVLYLISGHGGPDPGAIGQYMNKSLHEDEYAYDVTLRLARKLMANGAKVHIIIQDSKDGIRDEEILSVSQRETCMGKKIPLSQKKRLKQRSDAVNKLYSKEKNATYQRCIVLHVDSRSKGKRLDVFFYHYPSSSKGKRLANTLSDTFEKKYGVHQPGRGFSGTVSQRELYVVKNTAPPVAFVELGNIQNRYDQIRFVKADNRQALANWIYEGIKRDFKKEKR